MSIEADKLEAESERLKQAADAMTNESNANQLLEIRELAIEVARSAASVAVSQDLAKAVSTLSNEVVGLREEFGAMARATDDRITDQRKTSKKFTIRLVAVGLIVGLTVGLTSTYQVHREQLRAVHNGCIDRNRLKSVDTKILDLAVPKPPLPTAPLEQQTAYIRQSEATRIFRAQVDPLLAPEKC